MAHVGERYCSQELQGFTPIPDWISRIPEERLCWNEKALLARLQRYGQATGEIFPAIESLARELGLSQRTIWRYLGSLKGKKFIERERCQNSPSRFFLVRTSETPENTETANPGGSGLATANPGGSELPTVAVATISSEDTSLKENTPYKPPSQKIQNQNLIPGEANASGEEVCNVLNRTPRIKRLNKAERTAVVERASAVLIPVSDWERHATAYALSDFAREHDWKIHFFLKNPTSWVPSYEPSPQQTPNPAVAPAPRLPDSPEPQASPSHLPAQVTVPIGESGLPVPVEMWNRLVPSGVKITFWEFSNGNHAALKAAWSNERYRSNFETMCVKAEPIIKALGPEVWWLNFFWLLRPDNWQKLLSGVMDGMPKKNRQQAPARLSREAEGLAATERAKKLVEEQFSGSK